jgi:hypothetical protein
LQTTPSGTYFNASQGAFVTVAVPIRVLAKAATNGLTLTWNSQPGTVYRVQAKDDLRLTSWTDVSGDVTATGTNASWTDESLAAHSQRFYRIKKF